MDDQEELTELDMVRRVAWAWKAAGLDEKMKSCIQSTRIGLDVLANLGIQARALPCAIVVRNAEAVDASLRGLPVQDWPPSAWSVGIDPDAPPADSGVDKTTSTLFGGGKVFDNRTGERGWNGHLIIEGGGWLLDLSANQFSRPLREMELHAWAAPVSPLDLEAGDNSWLITMVGGVNVRIYPRPELAAWRNGAAWREDPPEEAVTAVTYLAMQGPRR